MKHIESSAACRIDDIGIVDYLLAYERQKDAVQSVIAGGTNTLIICEHPPVFTLGRLATEENILLSKDAIEKKGIRILRIDRGGEVTFHGPGQIVAYPIFQLNHFGKDLRLYMAKLEQVTIDLLQHFGIVANRIEGQRGIWAGKKKIASIGIGVRKWVSFHGMAVNVNTDLNFFSMIKPCGLNVEMTSMAELLGSGMDLSDVKRKMIHCFGKNFDLEFIKGDIYGNG